MRTFTITRSTMEWSRIRDPESREFRQLVVDIQQMLRYDDRHVHGEDVELPEGIEQA